MSNTNKNNINHYIKENTVLNHLIASNINYYELGCFLVSPDGKLLDFSGAIEKYKYKDIKKGDNLFEKIAFTQGIIPYDEEENLILDCVEIEDNVFVDIYVLPKDNNNNNWVILLDSKKKAERNIILKQKINDLSLLKEQQDILLKKLKESDERYRKLFENSNDGIYIYDDKGNIIDANETILDILGYSREELIGTNLSKIYENYEMENKYISSKFETHLKTKDGEVIPVEISKGSFESDSQIFYQEFVRDITIRKTIELSLHTSKQKAEEAIKIKTNFLSTISREIRTPMNGVMGMSQLLLETPLNSEQLDIVRSINKSGEVLINILNDILDFSKVESDKIDLEIKPFNLVKCIEDIFEIFYTSSKSKGIQLLYLIDEKLPSWLLGDINRIKQIIINLLSNSMKFTEKGNITISIKLLSKKESSFDIEFIISDTGNGIPKEKLDKIIKDLYQTDLYKTTFGGIGLGLTVCSTLVKAMGGKISVDSSEKGTNFSFNLVLDSDSTIPKLYMGNDLTNTTLEKNLFEKIPLKILIAEDNAISKKLIVKVLGKMGYYAETVSNGFEVINKVLNSNYDLIFMDVKMPDMDGITATRKIEELIKDKPVIIAVTANATKIDRENCLDAGMNDYLSKPISIVDIQNIIKKWFNSKL
ncbi:MAG: ATP-binding protein [Candidatus Sericytochromatia bacterium]